MGDGSGGICNTQREISLTACFATALAKQIGTIKPKTRRGREVRFLQETRLLAVRFIYAHLLISFFLLKLRFKIYDLSRFVRLIVAMAPTTV